MKYKNLLKNLLKPSLILFALLILGLTYQFVYKKNLSEIKTINNEITTLSATLSDLEQKQVNEDAMLKENDSLTRQINNRIAAYGTGTTEEKSILFINSLEQSADMVIDTITFSEPEYFLNGAENSKDSNAEEDTEETDPDTSEETDPDTSEEADLDTSEETDLEGTEKSDLNTAVDNTDSTPEEEADNLSGNLPTPIDGIGAAGTIDMQAVKGYQSAITITFKVSYDGLKKCIDYINTYTEKRNIDEITLSYDSETGNLTGSMKINMYNLVGNGITYTEPAIGNVDIGLDNIFGTIDFNPN